MLQCPSFLHVGASFGQKEASLKPRNPVSDLPEYSLPTGRSTTPGFLRPALRVVRFHWSGWLSAIVYGLFDETRVRTREPSAVPLASSWRGASGPDRESRTGPSRVS